MMTRKSLIKSTALAALATLAACGRSTFPAPDAPTENAAPDIDLSAYELTFSDEFDEALDASGHRCDTKWITHTPYNGDFGIAEFAHPSRGFPFVIKDGILRIEARNTPDDGWKAGLLSSWNSCDEGFAQQYGYFELSAQLPAGEGFWPAFWLLGTDRDPIVPEVDIFEYHTTRPRDLEITIHIHDEVIDDGPRQFKAYHIEKVEPGSLSKGFNTYGVDVQEDEMVFYLNRREVWRTPTLPEFRVPLYILINLGMEQHDITKNTPEFDYMYVDYVRAYSRR